MKTVLITGIGRGIGYALAEKFLSENYAVLGTFFKTPADLQNEQLKTFSLDLSDPKSIASCTEGIKKLGVKIDIFINNAGALFDEDETTVIVEKLRKTLEVNLIGTIDFTEQLISQVADDGHIINISSSAGSLSQVENESHFPGHYPAYKISKTALNMYTYTLALRLAGRGTIISSVHPGWVKTDMGGEDADITPEAAAESIYKFAISRPETGGFWFNGESYPW